MNCPRCHSVMRDVRGVAVCTSCGGAFVSCAANDTVQRAFDPHAQSMAELAAQHARGPAVVDTNARVACPSCGAAMARFVVGPVEVDTCFAHGSWYDRGELARVRDALAAGAPTAEVATAAPSAAAAPGRAAPALELARPHRKSPPPTPRPASEIDPSAQAAIADLIKHEHAAARRARRRHRRHGHDHSALEIVEDILDLFD